MSVVCIGDSVTFGQHLDPGLDPWPLRIGAVGRGISGETTRQALERWPRDVQENPANVTVIQYGHNDANCWQTDRGLPRVSLDAYRANLAEMVHRCRMFDTTPMLCNIVPSRKNPGYDEDVAEYSAALEQVAARMHVELVDVREAFLALDLDRLLMGDGLHLTDDGHAVYAHAVESVLLRAQVAA